MHLHRLNCERCNFHNEIISQWNFHTRKLFTTKLPRWNILQMIMLSHDYFAHDEFTSIKSRPMLFPRLNRLKTGAVLSQTQYAGCKLGREEFWAEIWKPNFSLLRYFLVFFHPSLSNYPYNIISHWNERNKKIPKKWEVWF